MLFSTYYTEYKNTLALGYVVPWCGQGIRKIIGAWDGYPTGLHSICEFAERHIDTVMMEKMCEEIGGRATGHTAPHA
jgi:hypothetical protein